MEILLIISSTASEHLKYICNTQKYYFRKILYKIGLFNQKNFPKKIIFLRFKKNNKSFISKDEENNKTGLLSTNLNNEKNDENINNHIKNSYETDKKN